MQNLSVNFNDENDDNDDDERLTNILPQNLSVNASIFTLTAIAVDRYKVIYDGRDNDFEDDEDYGDGGDYDGHDDDNEPLFISRGYFQNKCSYIQGLFFAREQLQFKVNCRDRTVL